MTEKEFNGASAVIKYRGEQKGKEHHFNKEKALMGKLRCGNCGRSLIRITCTSIPCYLCERPKYDEKSGCFSGRLWEPDIETQVLEQINQKWLVRQEENTPEDDVREADGREADSDKGEKKVLKKKQEFLKAKKQGLYESYKLGGMSRNDYLNKVSELREKEEKLWERVSEIEAMNEQREKTEKDVLKTGKQEKLTRTLVEQCIDRIDVYGEHNIEIVWK